MNEEYFYLCTYISCNIHDKKMQATDMYISNFNNVYYTEYDEKIINNYIGDKENIFKLLQKGSIIQITNDNYEYTAIIGNITYEGKRLEKNVLDVIDFETGLNLHTILYNIDNRISNNTKIKNKLYKKKLGGIYE